MCLSTFTVAGPLSLKEVQQTPKEVKSIFYPSVGVNRKVLCSMAKTKVKEALPYSLWDQISYQLMSFVWH